jgi:hypothetical protein
VPLIMRGVGEWRRGGPAPSTDEGRDLVEFRGRPGCRPAAEDLDG